MKNKQIYCITGKSGISNLCSFTKKKGLTSGGKSGILVKQMTFTGRRRLGMSKDLRFAMLLDCYGEFLTPHQYRLTELYYCADLSLSEIAEIVGITRQGVRDGIKRGEQILQEMEDKLQFAARFNALRENYSAIASTLQLIQTQTADQPQVQTACREAMEAVHHGLELL